jgi:hypothetical protein
METPETPVEGQEQIDEVRVAAEKEAKEKGWKPKDEYDGEEWVDADEFLKRAPLYKRIGTQSKRLREMEKTVTEMSGHMSKVQEAAYRKAMSDLQAKKEEAIEFADKDAVKAIDKQIGTLEKEMQPAAPAVDPAITAWENDPTNDWYKTDAEMGTFAYSWASAFNQRNPGVDAEVWLAEMTKATKRAFPEKFKNERRTDHPPVDTGGSVGGKKKLGMSDCNDMQRKVINDMKRNGVFNDKFTVDDYIQQLADIGEVGGKK